MYLQFLGTGAGSPSHFRNVSALAFKFDAEIWLFDCGEGTQQQILRTNIHPGRISRIFISYFHGDHLFGLPSLPTRIKFLRIIHLVMAVAAVTILAGFRQGSDGTLIGTRPK